MDNNKVITSIIEHVECFVNKIDNNEFLTKEECNVLMIDMETIHAIKLGRKKGREHANMASEYDVVLNEFREYADDSTELLEKMIQVISEGRIPAVDEVEKLDSCIAELRNKYNDIYQTALFELLPEEMPREGEPADLIVQALKNSQKNQIKKQLEAAKNTLSRFIAVRSSLEMFSGLISDFQKEANELLNSIRKDAFVLDKETEKMIEGPEAFLNALDCENYNTPESFALINTVNAYYPPMVGNGLISKQYYIDERVLSSLDNSNGYEQSLGTADVLVNEDETKAIETEEDYPYNKEPEGSESSNDDSNISNDSIVSKLGYQLLKSDAIPDENYDFGNYFVVSQEKSKKKFSSKEFKNDISTSPTVPVEVAILREIRNMALTTHEIMHEIIKQIDSKDIIMIPNAFKHLYNKGYIDKYGINGVGEFYCASKRGWAALSSEMACKFLKITPLKSEDMIDTMNRSSAVANRIAYSNIIRDYVKNNLIATNRTHCILEDNSFIYEAIRSNRSHFLALGLFDSNADNYKQIEDNILDISDKTGIPNVVVVACADEVFIHRALPVIAELFNTLPDRGIFGYSLKDNKFYDFQLNEIEQNAIWNGLKADEEEKGEENSFNNQINQNLIEKNSVEKKETQALQNQNNVNIENYEGKEDKIDVIDSKNDNKSSDSVFDTVSKMILKDKIYCATAYLKAISNSRDGYKADYERLAYAVFDPMYGCSYNASKMFEMIPEKKDEFTDYLMLSSVIRTLFYNHMEYDYNIESLFGSELCQSEIVAANKSLNDFMYKLMSFKKEHHKGIDFFADYRMKDSIALENRISEVRNRAKEFYESVVVGKSREENHPRFNATKKAIFAADNDFAQCLQMIINNDDSANDYIKDFVSKKFIRDERTIDSNNVDSIKIDAFMDEYWKEADKEMRTKRQSDSLIGVFHEKLSNLIKKAVSILCDWIINTDDRSDSHSVQGVIEFKKQKSAILKDLYGAISFYDDVKNEKTAGLCILLTTLNELKLRMEGDYDEKAQKYFYVDFLKTGHVLLDENLHPILNDEYEGVPALSPENRVLKHFEANDCSYNERLTEIFCGGDDYGSAQILFDYLGIQASDIEGIEENSLEESIQFARSAAENSRKRFIDNLELMQSYGQITNSSEGNHKEDIHRVIENAYNKALEDNNFGFFKNVMDAYNNQIKEDAKPIGEKLKKELEAYKNSHELDEEDDRNILDMIERIEAELEKQNYTVAEDFIGRLIKGEPYFSQDLLPGFDSLKHFIETYEAQYKRVVDRTTISNIIKSPHNRNEREAVKVASLWIENNQNLKPEKIKELFTLLGFQVDSVSAQPATGVGYSVYFMKLTKPENGRKTNYKHPIAAFGSQAEENSIRIVAIPRKMKAEELLQVIKNLGNSKDTIILLDSTLTLAERRMLARKLKMEAYGKIFGIIDRVMFLYLIHNYNITLINQILMQVMLPFAYYQPYVWDSAQVMSPEIFMGRDEELEKIESPRGVNIVYGGRQLGKSALLKMAKKNIDHDENGNRAVYIDIKGKDYKQAAKKISNVLFDDGILAEDLNTESWEELSRSLQQRLKQTDNRIPYLLLLLDEADAFIESCGEINYTPFDALKDIQSVGEGRFKFVIAGLRNIVKFNREKALSNNSVLTHLTSITVRPFKEKEARELLEIPLYYLGFRFPAEKDTLISMIFANANYFPGLIQLYCGNLVEALKKDYAGYNEDDTPIYEIQDNIIRKVVSEGDFQQQIKDKYMITLRLDEDNYYYIIALIMAFLYHEKQDNDGYSPEKVKIEGQALGIEKIANLSEEKLKALMEEMCDLNVLRKSNSQGEKFVFNRNRFFEIMGTREEVEEQLYEFMGE